MAEGWARQRGDGDRIASAGIKAHGLNPRAVLVMREAGVDISRQTSDLLSDISPEDFDVVITVCGDADEKCPVLPGSVKRLHWPLPDPAGLTGTEDEILEGFRQVRDDIRQRVNILMDDLQGDS